MKKILYGEETKKAMNSFGSGQTPFKLIKAYAEVKKAAISAAQEYNKKLPEDVYTILISSLDKIINGDVNSFFPLPLFQGGAGTSLHMNINEVIYRLANELYLEQHQQELSLDLYESINIYQSTNDTFPTAVTISLYRELISLEESVIKLQETFVELELKWQNLLTIGRTEFQDALPITLGQIFGSYAGAIERDRWRLNKLKERVRSINLGGTAIGTCFFAPREYVFLAEKNLREITNLPLSRSQNLPDETSHLDKWSELACGIKIIAENLLKISNDFLILTSSFSKEVIHPNLQYGSTIMPAKTNPVILEYVKGIAIDTIHETQKASHFASQGTLQLNSFLPFLYKSLLAASENTNNAIISLAENFLNQITINEHLITENLINSPVLLNTLRPLLGYMKVKEIWTSLEKKKFTDIDSYINTLSRMTDVSPKDLKERFKPGSITSYSE